MHAAMMRILNAFSISAENQSSQDFHGGDCNFTVFLDMTPCNLV
jgi:hypothetical protein